MWILILHGVFGLGFLWNYYVLMLRTIDQKFATLDLPPLPTDIYLDGQINADIFFNKGVQIIYYIISSSVMIKILLMNKKHSFSRFTLFSSLVIRFVPAIVIGY